MGDTDLEARISTFVDPQSHAHVGVVSVISEKEFAWAQVVIPDLSSYLSYQDWLDSREGFQIGLAMAGVDVKMISVPLSPFLVWCRLTGTPPAERTLDAFAAMLLILRRPPAPAALAIVRRREFEAYARTVEAFAPHVDYEHWTRHRAALQNAAAEAGARIEPLPVHVDDFIEWGQCLHERTSEAMLDRYAALILEFLTDEERS
jgi:hypothetical protein